MVGTYHLDKQEEACCLSRTRWKLLERNNRDGGWAYKFEDIEVRQTQSS